VVNVTGGYLVGRNDIVREPDQAAGFANTHHFDNGLARIGIVMQRDAIRDQIKCVVTERQRVRVGGFEFDIGDAALIRKAARGFEHLRREVNGDNVRDERREFQGGVSRAGRNIEHVPGWLWMGEFNEARETFTLRVNCAGRVLVSVRAELRLNLFCRIIHFGDIPIDDVVMLAYIPF